MKYQIHHQFYICRISKTTSPILTKFTVSVLFMYEKKVACDISSNLHDYGYLHICG